MLDLNRGELIMEYCGEVLDAKEFKKRSYNYSASGHQHFYFMALSQDNVCFMLFFKYNYIYYTVSFT